MWHNISLFFKKIQNGDKDNMLHYIKMEWSIVSQNNNNEVSINPELFQLWEKFTNPTTRPTLTCSNQTKKTNNKRKRSTTQRRRKRARHITSDDSESDSGSNSDSDSNEPDDDAFECPNPLCDHTPFTKTEQRNGTSYQWTPPTELRNIGDMIALGKGYHCQKNKKYFAIDLRVMCNLVSPLTELNNMVGMQSVKDNIANQIIFFLQGFNIKDRCGKCQDCSFGLDCTMPGNTDMLHTVITGPPGVGKTELGRILGKIYKGMGVLQNGTVHVAKRSDLIGKYLGHTAAKTQDFFNKCKGGVMFIDEAYSLGHQEGRDSFSKECIDTINQNMSDNRDVLVIIAGYADALEKCFFSYNEGLKRRFAFRYDIKGYAPHEIMEIFLRKVNQEGWRVSCQVPHPEDGSHPVATSDVITEQNKMESFFKKNEEYFPHFGGDAESLFLSCKIVHSKRVVFLPVEAKKILTLDDIENAFGEFVKHRKYKERKNMLEVPIGVQHMYR